MSRFQVKKVAVLGAGVMGAQIAAHLVNVKVPVVLFDRCTRNLAVPPLATNGSTRHRLILAPTGLAVSAASAAARVSAILRPMPL